MKPNEAAVIDSWAGWMRHNLGRSEGTIAKYRRYIEELSEWLGGCGASITSATRAQLEEFSGPVLYAKGITPRSRRPYVAAVRTFYKWARSNNIVFDDPSKHLVYPNIGSKMPKGMSLHHAELLLMQPDLATFRGVRDSAILHLFIGAGLRLAGLVSLNESDLNFTDWAGKEHLVLRVNEKGDKERLIPVPHEARLMIRAYLGHPELQSIDRELPNGDKVLFVSTANRTIPEHEYFGERRRLSRRSTQDMVKMYSGGIGIPDDVRHPHALRHLYGTELAEDDVHLLKMQALLGHSRSDDTKAYAHVAIRSLAKAVDQANPLAKMKTPASALARRLR